MSRGTQAALALWSVSLSFFEKISLLLNCRSSPLVQISIKPAYMSSVSLLISFCFFYPQTSPFIMSCHLCLTVQLSKKLDCSSSDSLKVSVPFIHRGHRFQSIVVHLYQFRYCIWHTRAMKAFWSVSVTFIQKEHHFHSTVVHLTNSDI